MRLYPDPSATQGVSLWRQAGARRLGPWLIDRRFDLTMLIGNVIIVPIVLLMTLADGPSAALNVAVTALVGGPHLFATFSATASDPAFRRKLPWAVPSSLLIPCLVVWLSV